MDTFYGFKVGQSQAYDKEGFRVPVTMIKAEPLAIKNSRQVTVGKYTRELGETLTVGEPIKASDVFVAGDKVKVTGISKGKGFAGVMKRHHFHGGPKTHGQSVRARHPGSIGQSTTPGRVYRGKRMAGHMGNVQRTVTGLQIFDVKPEENLLLIRGLVPGNKGGLIKITKE
ncbi:50S ribosomal protein L3 [Patescibacteria group bacterium]|nr:50S ribosomal protein L3 [Patescibacteria group bacterium]